MSTNNFQVLTCDRCGKSETIPFGDQGELNLRTIRISVDDPHYTSGRVFVTPVDWCYDCRVKMHIEKPPVPVENPPADAPPPPEPLPTRPSVDDYIREIVRETVREEMES